MRYKYYIEQFILCLIAAPFVALILKYAFSIKYIKALVFTFIICVIGYLFGIVIIPYISEEISRIFRK